MARKSRRATSAVRSAVRTRVRQTTAPKKAPAGAPSEIPRAHGRFDYSPILDRPPLRWPNGARVALWVIPNIEHFLFDRPGTKISGGGMVVNPDILNYAWRDYGVRVGIWRLMEIMAKFGVRGTVALNSDVCREYPRILEEGRKLNWEWMGHGITNSIILNQQTEAEERALIKETVSTITRAAGKAPRGWLSEERRVGKECRSRWSPYH